MRSGGFRILQCGMFCALMCALAPGAPARAGDAPPLLSAFQRLCIDSNAEPAKVVAAALAAGAVQNSDTNKEILPYTVWTWTLRQDGLHLMISAETWRIPARDAGSADLRINDCRIWILGGADADDVAAVERWIGVAPTPINPPETFVTTYDYQMAGGQRLALPESEAERRAIEAAGRHWHLVVTRGKRGGASLTLSHFLNAGTR